MIYFRFHFAHGGHANDMDLLQAAIRFFPGKAGLLDTFARLGIGLDRIPPDVPRREVGKTYDSADWERYADPISAYPEFANPGFTRIGNIPVHLSVATDHIRIAVSGARGNHWVIDDTDFHNARSLETQLAQRGVRFVAIASRQLTENLFCALRSHQLPDLKTHRIAQQELVAKGMIPADSLDPALASYERIRRDFGAEFADDDVWRDAHDEIHGLVRYASCCDARPDLLAYRCPGFSEEVIERVCAETRFSMR